MSAHILICPALRYDLRPFGAGTQPVVRGGETFATFVANSGGLRSDVRTRITASLSKSGALDAAFFG